EHSVCVRAAIWEYCQILAYIGTHKGKKTLQNCIMSGFSSIFAAGKSANEYFSLHKAHANASLHVMLSLLSYHFFAGPGLPPESFQTNPTTLFQPEIFK
ncbi:MAG: hypothetical protein IK009_05480, partial [Bacteroidales bacterium]|nr:hypothetical protein [Bacteroidales bacterium]